MVDDDGAGQSLRVRMEPASTDYSSALSATPGRLPSHQSEPMGRQPSGVTQGCGLVLASSSGDTAMVVLGANRRERRVPGGIGSAWVSP
jgi:hypothetical protein